MTKRRAVLLLFFLIACGGFFIPFKVYGETDPYLGYQLYWGDLHGHTVISDGLESPTQYFINAKNNGMNFTAISDHAERTRMCSVPDSWQIIKNAVNSYYSPGNFVTLMGFEWSDWSGCNPYPTPSSPINPTDSCFEGHKNVYYSGVNGNFITSAKEQCYNVYGFENCCLANAVEKRTSGELFSALNDPLVTGGDEALIIPHHVNAKHLSTVMDNVMRTKWFNDDGSNITDPKMNLVEIYSKWGSGEWGYKGQTGGISTDLARPSAGYVENNSVQDALSHGIKLAFVGGSDTHKSQPGSVNLLEEPFSSTALIYKNSGITGVFAQSLTREGVFEALKKGRTYAASGRKIKAFISADGHLPGETYTMSNAPQFTGHVETSGPGIVFDWVQIVKGGVGNTTPFPVAATFCQNTSVCDFTWTDNGFNRDAFYYIRVKQHDGENDGAGNMAWVSPIWVNFAPPSPTPVIVSCTRTNIENGGKVRSGEIVNYQVLDGTSGWLVKDWYGYNDAEVIVPPAPLTPCPTVPDGAANPCSITVDAGTGKRLWTVANLRKNDIGDGYQYSCRWDGNWQKMDSSGKFIAEGPAAKPNPATADYCVNECERYTNILLGFKNGFNKSAEIDRAWASKENKCKSYSSKNKTWNLWVEGYKKTDPQISAINNLYIKCW